MLGSNEHWHTLKALTSLLSAIVIKFWKSFYLFIYLLLVLNYTLLNSFPQFSTSSVAHLTCPLIKSNNLPSCCAEKIISGLSSLLFQWNLMPAHEAFYPLLLSEKYAAALAPSYCRHSIFLMCFSFYQLAIFSPWPNEMVFTCSLYFLLSISLYLSLFLPLFFFNPYKQASIITFS